MKIANLNWEPNDGEGSIKLTEYFLEGYWVMQADALLDCIVDLQNCYNFLLTSHNAIRCQADVVRWAEAKNSTEMPKLDGQL